MEAALSHCGATSTQRGRSSPAAFGLRKALADDENRQTSKPCPSLLPGTRWLAAGSGGWGRAGGRAVSAVTRWLAEAAPVLLSRADGATPIPTLAIVRVFELRLESRNEAQLPPRGHQGTGAGCERSEFGLVRPG